jgi:hypothetical protein
MARPKNREPLTQEALHSLFRYDSRTGHFYRLRATGGTRVGEQAGRKTADRYRRISINGRSYLASRLAWFYIYGGWPKNEIDHINHDTSDDRIDNLREATRSQNCFNSNLSKNISGYRGVSHNYAKWKAIINIGKKRFYLGTFETREEAAEAYNRAAKEMFGEFAGPTVKETPNEA